MDEGTGSQRHPVRVLVRDEEVHDVIAHSWMHISSEASDDAQGHGWKFEPGDPQEGVAGQVYVMSVHHEGDEALMNRGSFLRRIDPDDSEGEEVGGLFYIPPVPTISTLRGSGRASSSPTLAEVGPSNSTTTRGRNGRVQEVETLPGPDRPVAVGNRSHRVTGGDVRDDAQARSGAQRPADRPRVMAGRRDGPREPRDRGRNEDPGLGHLRAGLRTVGWPQSFATRVCPRGSTSRPVPARV